MNDNKNIQTGSVTDTNQPTPSVGQGVNGVRSNPAQPTNGQPVSNLPSTNSQQQATEVSEEGTQTPGTADELLTDKLYPEDLDSQWNVWKCLTCGYVYEGVKPLNKCPRCGNTDPDKFDDPY